jgi:hypothetical protein
MITKYFKCAAIAVFALTISTSGLAQGQSAAARTFADAVLKMFDAGQCSKLYDAFDDSSKTLTKDQWNQVCAGTLKQRGDVIQRSSPNATNSMGIYRFVFSTQCTGGKVFEDVAVIYKDTDWKLASFFVKPNLE